MTNDEILDKLHEIFSDILDCDDLELTPRTSAADIEEWDSLTNVQLIVEIESEFGIRFTSSEIQSWKNVGDMVECIAGK